MPPPESKPPRGLSAGLWDKIVRRVKQEGPGEDGSPDVSPSMMDRIRDRVKRWLGPEEAKPNTEEGPVTDEVKRQRIREAGKLQVLLLLRYHGQIRHVEPYSFRLKKPGDNKDSPYGYWDEYQPLEEVFYGYCLIHTRIHQFKLSKIEEIYITDQKFEPRWIIEL